MPTRAEFIHHGAIVQACTNMYKESEIDRHPGQCDPVGRTVDGIKTTDADVVQRSIRQSIIISTSAIRASANRKVLVLPVSTTKYKHKGEASMGRNRRDRRGGLDHRGQVN